MLSGHGRVVVVKKAFNDTTYVLLCLGFFTAKSQQNERHAERTLLSRLPATRFRHAKRHLTRPVSTLRDEVRPFCEISLFTNFVATRYHSDRAFAIRTSMLVIPFGVPVKRNVKNARRVKRCSAAIWPTRSICTNATDDDDRLAKMSVDEETKNEPIIIPPSPKDK